MGSSSSSAKSSAGSISYNNSHGSNSTRNTQSKSQSLTLSRSHHHDGGSTHPTPSKSDSLFCNRLTKSNRPSSSSFSSSFASSIDNNSSGQGMSDLTFLLAFRYLPLSDICTFRRVNHRFLLVSRHPTLWSQVELCYSPNTSHYPPLAAMLGIHPTCPVLLGSSGPTTGDVIDQLAAIVLGITSLSGSECLCSIPPLPRLSFDNYSFIIRDIKTIKHLSKIQILSIRRCYSLIPELCSAISEGCHGLKKLILSSCNVSDHAIKQLINPLSISPSSSSPSSSPSSSSSSSLTQLELLNLSHNRFITTDACYSISMLTSLARLDLSECRSLDTDSIRTLCESKYLQNNLIELSIRGIETMGDCAVILIADNLCHIKNLNIRWCKLITDKSMMELSQKLYELEILNASELIEITMDGVLALIHGVSSKLQDGDVDLRWNKRLIESDRQFIRKGRPTWKVA